MRRAIFAVALVFACVLGARADVVHVYEQTSAGGVINQISDTTLDTGRTYYTQPAPEISGYIFTDWTISTKQAFEARDDWGRAFDSAPYKLYEETVLTANYLAASIDSDGDGISDGYERYWYGNLDCDGASDTDGDGATFAEELAAGTNPLFPERHAEGPVTYADGDVWLYNPHGYATYTITSEPKGALFATVSEYMCPGATVTTTGIDVSSANGFAYWSVDGVRQADPWGRALDSVSFAMPNHAIEIVAHYESDYETRMKLYWYGDASVAMTSDTDGDGATFAEELAAGTNPLFSEHHVGSPVSYCDSENWLYYPQGCLFTIRSEPEGALFETIRDYTRPGATVTTTGMDVSPTNGFAYWSIDGVRQADPWGRALDSVSLVLPSNGVEIVAHYESDYETRMKLYWYGDLSVAMESDTDGDGATFAEELAAGTNPLFPEWHLDGPIVFIESDAVVVGEVPVFCESETLTGEDQQRIRDLVAMRLATDYSRIVVKTAMPDVSPALVAYLGVAPACSVDELGVVTATFAMPKLIITSFDPDTGDVVFKVVPGEGNSIVRELATGCIRVYGSSSFSEQMSLISQVRFDLSKYLTESTKGEVLLTVELGNHKFLRVKADSVLQ